MTVSLPLSHQMVFSRILTCKYQYKGVGSAVWFESGDSFQRRVAIPPESGTHVFAAEAFSSTRYGRVHVRQSLASTPNANSCGQVRAGTRSRLRDTLMCICPIRWRLRQIPFLASMFSPLSFSSTQNAHMHVANSMASTPNANFCYFLTLPITYPP